MAELQICLLGSFQVLRDFVPVPASALRNPAAVRLLKLALLTRPDPLRTEDAVRLLGLNPVDLPVILSQIRRVLEPDASLSVSETGQMAFSGGPQCWVDLDALRQHHARGAAAAARGEMLPAMLELQEADALYQGDLLEETQESWVLPLRRQIRELYTEILERLAEGHAVLARYQDAVGFCEKALAHDPLREATYQRMMAYHYYLGNGAGVSQVFKVCQESLESAGRSVSAETVRLLAQLTGPRAPKQSVPSTPASDVGRKIRDRK